MDISRRGFIGGTLVAATAAKAFAGEGVPAYNLKDYKTGALGKIVGELPPGKYDTHVHAYPGKPNPKLYADRLAEAGFRGGVVLSECPHPGKGVPVPDPEKAMDLAIKWASGSPTIYPYYWINPVLDNACDLVDRAVEKGFYGFKCLPSHYYPGDPRAMKAYERMAKAGKPVLFHSGILWDGKPSSKYTRPGNWEEIIDIPNLRFACAHISWPWYEECVAVYGKFLNALTQSSRPRAEMFVDTTPGTPRRVRRTALEMLYGYDYDMNERVLFGTDCRTNNYNVDWAKEWLVRDGEILADLGKETVDPDSYYRRAFQRFLFGGSSGERRLPTPDGTKKKI